MTTSCARKQTPSHHAYYYIDHSTYEMMEEVNADIMRISDIKPQFRLVSNPEPNAYARLINGDPYITVNSGMINVIGSNKNEYAYLIAHECAHLASQHSAEEKNHNTKMRGIGDAIILGAECIGMAFGIPLGLLSIFTVDSGTELVSLKYDRDQERAADRLAIDYVISAGYDPKGAISFHEKLSEVIDESIFSMLSTHPSEKERISYIRMIVEERTDNKKSSNDIKPEK